MEDIEDLAEEITRLDHEVREIKHKADHNIGPFCGVIALAMIIYHIFWIH